MPNHVGSKDPVDQDSHDDTAGKLPAGRGLTDVPCDPIQHNPGMLRGDPVTFAVLEALFDGASQTTQRSDDVMPNNKALPAMAAMEMAARASMRVKAEGGRGKGESPSRPTFSPFRLSFSFS